MHISKLALATAMLFSTAAFAQFSSPMRDVENIARYPANGTCTMTFSFNVPGAQACVASFFSVPPGKPIVIKQILGVCISGGPLISFHGGFANFLALEQGQSVGPSLGYLALVGEPQQILNGITYKEIRLTGLSTNYGGRGPTQYLGIQFSFSRATGETLQEGTCRFTATGYYVP